MDMKSKPTQRPLAPKKNAPASDKVYTPVPLAQHIISSFPLQGRLLDPSRGGGAFYNNFPAGMAKEWCEIEEGVDFLEYCGRVDWVVTNPPWSRTLLFLRKSMQISDNVVFLLTLNHIATKARMRLLREEGFGIKEIHGVATPPSPWPWSGFQLAAIHFQRAWDGATLFSGEFG